MERQIIVLKDGISVTVEQLRVSDFMKQAIVRGVEEHDGVTIQPEQLVQIINVQTAPSSSDTSSQ